MWAAMLALAMLSPHTARSQALRAGVGAVIPIGSSADRLNPGYHAMLSYEFGPGRTRNAVRLEGAVNSMSQRTPNSGKRQVLSGTANLIIRTGQSAPTGYIVIGAGSYQQSGGARNRTDPGVNVGAGIQFSRGFFGTFIEARLHYVNDEQKTKYFPMLFGLTF